jgi:hypothetical protein
LHVNLLTPLHRIARGARVFDAAGYSGNHSNF